MAIISVQGLTGGDCVAVFAVTGRGEDKEGEGEDHHHQHGSSHTSLDFGREEAGHQLLQVLQLLGEGAVISLQLAHLFSEQLVPLRAQFHPILETLHVILLPLPTLLRRDFILYLSLDALQVFLLCLGEGHVCGKADALLREQSFLFVCQQ